MEVSGKLYVTAALIPGNHWIRDWLGPRADMDSVEKKKIPSVHLPGTEPWSSSPYLSHYTK